jgi:hypothetical protein
MELGVQKGDENDNENGNMSGAERSGSDCIFLEDHIITIAVPWMDG